MPDNHSGFIFWQCLFDKCLKIHKGYRKLQTEEHTITWTTRQTIFHKTLHRKLKIEQLFKLHCRPFQMLSKNKPFVLY